MKTRVLTPFLKSINLSSLVIWLALVLTITWLESPKAQADSPNSALTVQVATSQGFAAPRNSLPAHILVVVTDRNGDPVTGLDQSAFGIINHFGLPGQLCGFSNSISSFGDIGSGAYQIKVMPGVAGCTWVAGDYLAQVAVTDGLRRGQTAASLSIR